MDTYTKTSNGVRVTTDKGIFERFFDGSCTFESTEGVKKTFPQKEDMSVRQFVQGYRAFCKDFEVDYNKISQLLRDDK